MKTAECCCKIEGVEINSWVPLSIGEGRQMAKVGMFFKVFFVLQLAFFDL